MAIAYPLDQRSFEIGMINAFVEMVACGVKPLAISPPIEPDHLELMRRASEELSQAFGTSCYIEQSLMITDIQSAAFTEGKYSILYYKDPSALVRYLTLKREADALRASGCYHGPRRREISVAFGRLLGYPTDVIHAKVDSEARIGPSVISGEET